MRVLHLSEAAQNNLCKALGQQRKLRWDNYRLETFKKMEGKRFFNKMPGALIFPTHQGLLWGQC